MHEKPCKQIFQEDNLLKRRLLDLIVFNALGKARSFCFHYLLPWRLLFGSFLLVKDWLLVKVCL